MQPPANQPHATLEVHHTVSGMAGDSYNTRLLIDGSLYDTQSFADGEIDGSPVRVRLQLEEQTITVTGSTYQRATGPTRTTEERREEYACHREECTSDTPPVCHTVEDTCFRTYTVPRVSGGTAAEQSEECQASVQLAPDVNHNYFIEFEYTSETECTATCYEHTSTTGGNYERTPCPRTY